MIEDTISVLEVALWEALEALHSAHRDTPTREKALAVTHMETACLWWDAVREAEDLPALGLAFYRGTTE